MAEAPGRAAVPARKNAGQSPAQASPAVRHYVQEQNEFSLVRYPPSERRINTMEKKLLEDHNAVVRLLGLADVFNPEVWRAAAVELVASALLDFLSYTAVVVILSTWREDQNPRVATSLIHLPIVALVILAAAPASGGHINPCITLATMLTGHSTPVRALLYIVAQCAGAVAAAATALRLLPRPTAVQFLLGGCSLRLPGPGGVTWQTGLLSEFVFTFTLLLLAYFIALDPRQLQVTGLVLAPFLVGAILSLLLFISGSLAPGYTGAGMSPGRCLGPALVLNHDALTSHLWVFWVGPFLASFAMALVYNLVPPHHVDQYARRKDVFHRVIDMMNRGSSDHRQEFEASFMSDASVNDTSFKSSQPPPGLNRVGFNRVLV